MPVRRFKTVAEMNGDHWYEPGDPALYRAIRRVWDLGHRTIRQHFPPGVHKSKTIEEMNALQKQWDDANFDAYRRRLEQEKADTPNRE